LKKIQTTLTSAKEKEQLSGMVSDYQSYLDLFIKTTMILGGALQKGEVEKGLANSAVYLDMMGKMVVAWLWIEMADKAIDRFGASDASAEDDQKPFLIAALSLLQKSKSFGFFSIAAADLSHYEAIIYGLTNPMTESHAYLHE
jgi:hypothetical protein